MIEDHDDSFQRTSRVEKQFSHTEMCHSLNESVQSRASFNMQTDLDVYYNEDPESFKTFRLSEKDTKELNKMESKVDITKKLMMKYFRVAETGST